MTVENGGNAPKNNIAVKLGDEFRGMRATAGVSLEQVQQDLRIKAKYIKALEDGDPSVLPGRAYVDGFLRNYATYLGMDPVETVERFAVENNLKTRAAAGLPTSQPQNTAVAVTLQSPDNVYTGSAQQKGFVPLLKRCAASLFPVALVAVTAFAGYTGYVAARDAGLIPPELGGSVRQIEDQVGDIQKTDAPEDQRAAADADTSGQDNVENAALKIPSLDVPVSGNSIEEEGLSGELPEDINRTVQSPGNAGSVAQSDESDIITPADDITLSSGDDTPLTVGGEREASSPDGSYDVDESYEARDIKRAVVGSESVTGRPVSLNYANQGSVPYWRAQPPAVEPDDGPVADINPESAGVLRVAGNDQPEEADTSNSRWTSRAVEEAVPGDEDATRIAAAAREALFGELQKNPPVARTDEARFAADTADIDAVSAGDGSVATDNSVTAADTDIFENTGGPDNVNDTGVDAVDVEVAALDILDDGPENDGVQIRTPIPVFAGSRISSAPRAVSQDVILTQPLPQQTVALDVIENNQPFIIRTDPVSVTPNVAPVWPVAGFAVVASNDSWIQVTDAFGSVRYTGILSPGESYIIPPEDGLRLSTGNAGGVFVEIDGQRFGPLGSSGSVVSDVTLDRGVVRSNYALSPSSSF